MSITRTADRLSQTLRYHRPAQFFWRLQRRTKAKLSSERRATNRLNWPAGRIRPDAVAALRELADRRIEYFSHRVDASTLEDLREGSFTFLNQRRTLATMEGGIDWTPKMPRLWLFQLQYHEYLLPLETAGYADRVWQIVADWLSVWNGESSFIPLRSDAWHPFCISRRLPIWLMLAATSPPPEAIASTFWQSVAQQAQWLAQNREVDLGGNHLLENDRALAMTAASIDAEWPLDRETLFRQFAENLQRQTLPSGEHEERTPTYHALMLLAAGETLSMAKAVNSDSKRIQMMERVAAAMSDFLRGLIHPDGQVPLLGDSAFEETPNPILLCRAVDQLISTRKQLEPSTARKTDSYFRWRDHPRNDFLLVDFGSLACDHLPAHGHADLFTFEASLSGHRWFVDQGNYDYEATEIRHSCRGTAAHNTLQVDDADHADLWSRFRMGRRGHPTKLHQGQKGPLRWGWATHDAYRRLGIAATGRFVAAKPGPIWIVVDWITGRHSHQLISRLRLHPEIAIDSQNETCICLAHPTQTGQQYTLRPLGDSRIDLLRGIYCPDFGVKHETKVIEVSKDAALEGWVGWVLHPTDQWVDVEVQREGNRLSMKCDQEKIEVGGT